MFQRTTEKKTDTEIRRVIRTANDAIKQKERKISLLDNKH